VDKHELTKSVTDTPDSISLVLAQFMDDNTVICTIVDDSAVNPGSIKEAKNSKYWNE
jgi:hypothetical protein